MGQGSCHWFFHLGTISAPGCKEQPSEPPCRGGCGAGWLFIISLPSSSSARAAGVGLLPLDVRDAMGTPGQDSSSPTCDSGMKQHLPEDVPCLNHFPFFSHKRPPPSCPPPPSARKEMGTSNLQLFEVAEEGACATQIGPTATDARARDSKK